MDAWAEPPVFADLCHEEVMETKHMLLGEQVGREAGDSSQGHPTGVVAGKLVSFGEWALSGQELQPRWHPCAKRPRKRDGKELLCREGEAKKGFEGMVSPPEVGGQGERVFGH